MINVFILSFFTSALLHTFLLLSKEENQQIRHPYKKESRTKVYLKKGNPKPKIIVPKEKKKMSLKDLGIGRTEVPKEQKQSGNLEEGFANLNKIKTEHPTYFDKMKSQIYNEYSPRVSQRLTGLRLNRKINTLKNITFCLLSLTIDAEGKLIDIYLVQSSGHFWFDNIAKESVTRAAPFRTPPSNILVNGKFNVIWQISLRLR